MGVKKRLDLIINELGVSGRRFARECGFSESYYATINDGIGADKLNKIVSAYPQVSLEWLVTGKGEMLKKDENSIGKTDASTSDLAERYLKMLEANARTIESQQQIIADMTKKLGNDAPRRVAKVGE